MDNSDKPKPVKNSHSHSVTISSSAEKLVKEIGLNYRKSNYLHRGSRASKKYKAVLNETKKRKPLVISLPNSLVKKQKLKSIHKSASNNFPDNAASSNNSTLNNDGKATQSFLEQNSNLPVPQLLVPVVPDSMSNINNSSILSKSENIDLDSFPSGEAEEVPVVSLSDMANSKILSEEASRGSIDIEKGKRIVGN